MQTIDALPCAVLITDAMGQMLAINQDLLDLIGGKREQWQQGSMEAFLPPASRIFLQTHVWPMLLKEGSVREIHLKLQDAQGQRVPTMVNCRSGVYHGAPAYNWVFFVMHERNQFETRLLEARTRAESAGRATAEAMRFITTVTDAMPGQVAYWDRDLRCRFANQPCLAALALPATAVIGMAMQDLIAAPLFEANRRQVEGALGGQTQLFERISTQPDGRIVHTLSHYIPDLDALGAVIGFFVLATDVTSAKVADGELRLAASVFQGTLEGILIAEVGGNILSVNPAFTTITGYAAAEVVGKTRDLLRPDPAELDLPSAMDEALATQGHWSGESWGRRRDGSAFRQWQTITTIASSMGGPDRHVLVFSDITERWRNDERARHLAFHDALTGLPNRALLIERLERLINSTRREPRNVVLMFIDLDGFKSINDDFGHAVGDSVLGGVAKKLQSQVRKTDTVARLGGDEFVILLDNPETLEQVAQIAQRIITTLGQAVVLDGQETRVGASIGIAVHPADGRTAATLIKSADAAMYAAKAAGKNTHRFSTPVPIDSQGG
jgi:diguanylate cyclase (GGDEF)-like protein/PAS domain S-box-containing protein